MSTKFTSKSQQMGDTGVDVDVDVGADVDAEELQPTVKPKKAPAKRGSKVNPQNLRVRKGAGWMRDPETKVMYLES